MTLLSIVLGCVGIIATALVAWLVYNKSSKLFKRIESILIARASKTEYEAVKRLIDDIERTGEKRGTVVQRPDGSWGVDWVINVGGGDIKPTGKLSTSKNEGSK